MWFEGSLWLRGPARGGHLRVAAARLFGEADGANASNAELVSRV